MNAQLAYVAEFERRWRARTPATDILDVLATTRVGRSEMRTWWHETFGTEMTLDDTTDVQPAVTKLLRRLRREFPNERW